MGTSPTCSAVIDNAAVRHLIAKIVRATCLDVYIRGGGEGTDWCMAYAEDDDPDKRRRVAVTEGIGPFEALDSLIAKLGYTTDADDNIVRVSRVVLTPAAVEGAVNLLDARAA